MRKLALVVLLAGCGRVPTAPPVSGVRRVEKCFNVMGWRQVYMTDALGVGRLDSIRVVFSTVCS